MALNSVLDDCTNAVLTTIVNLGLTDSSGVLVPVVKRKLPKRDETIDPATQITVCKSETAEEVRFYAFTSVKVRYPIEVTIISPNNRDQLTNLDVYANWRQTIRLALQKPPLNNLTEGSVVFDLDNVPNIWLDRQMINQDYDYLSDIVWCSSIEPPSS